MKFELKTPSPPLSSLPPLPIRDGVAPSYLWLQNGLWPDMLAFLEQQFPHIEPAIWIDRMRRGEVVDDAGMRLQPDSPYRAGSRIFYYRELEAETPIPFEERILHIDEHIVVADKPHFLPVIPAGRFLHETLLVRLKKKLGFAHLTPIHRIDRGSRQFFAQSGQPRRLSIAVPEARDEQDL
jgi:tRNA pseudouridine32 synthase/23S rRNA pseudouridine746 synthase